MILTKEGWFVLFVAFCAGWIANTMLRVLRGDAVYIAGEKVNRVQAISIFGFFLIVVGIFAAIQFGLIQDHYP